MCLFTAAPLVAQSVIFGTVVDPSGAAVPAAAVEARNLESGAVRSTVTGSSGRYVIPALPVGRYEVRAHKPQFRTEIRRGITLAAGQATEVNLSLEVGAVRQQVVVTAAVPLVSTAPRANAGLVGEQQVKQLPLNGRSYDQLLTLHPGIVDYTSQKTGGVGISNSAVAGMFAVSGRRPQENLFLLDGVEFTGAAEINLQPGGTSGELLGVDAVREFNVLTDTYGAQYGKRPGAQVVIVTQSGSNDLHGTAFEFLRNSALDARNFFDRGSVPRFGRQQFGASLGGPVQKDRTFLFGDYEGFRQHLGLSNVALVPDNAARQGYLPGPGGALSYVGLSPGVAPLLAFWPVQNGEELGGGIAKAFSHPMQTIREDFGTTRLDRQFAPRDSFSAVYTVDDSADDTPTQNPDSIDIESLREQVLSLRETHVFSSRLLNTAEAGFSRAAYFYTGQPAVDQPGFVAGRPMGALVIGGNATPNTPSQIALAGSNLGSNLFITRNLFTYQDALSLVRGRHQIKAGVWFQRVQANDNMALGQYGQAVFASLADFLKGTVTTFTAVSNPTPLGWRSVEGAWYVQDDLRLGRRLSLSLGFRDEFTDGWNEVAGRAANFWFGPDGALETRPHVGSSVFTRNHARFLPQPRIGLAWDPFVRGHTVLRAGFGMYNDLQDGLSYRLDQNAPFNTTITLKNMPVASLPIAPGSPLASGGMILPAGVQPDLMTPTVIAYTFTLQQELTPNTVLSASYAGSHGYHEILSLDANEPYPVRCPAVTCPPTLSPGTLYYAPGTPSANPALGSTWTWFSSGFSSYNALRVDLRRRFSRGLQVRAAYTWSKSLDNGDTLNGSAAGNAPGLAMSARDLRLDWGPATFDVRQAAAINGIWDLPFGRGRAGGWTLTAIATLHGGFPFTPELSFNPSNNGNRLNPVRPSLNPNFQRPIILGKPNRWYDPHAFVVPPNGTYGNLGRNALRGPGMVELDLGLLKNTRISEKLNLQFRAEAFNIVNRANFNTPNLIVFTAPAAPPSAAAGVITSTTTTSRQLQLALKLLW